MKNHIQALLTYYSYNYDWRNITRILLQFRQTLSRHCSPLCPKLKAWAQMEKRKMKIKFNFDQTMVFRRPSISWFQGVNIRYFPIFFVSGEQWRTYSLCFSKHPPQMFYVPSNVFTHTRGNCSCYQKLMKLQICPPKELHTGTGDSKICLYVQNCTFSPCIL